MQRNIETLSSQHQTSATLGGLPDPANYIPTHLALAHQTFEILGQN